MNVLKYHWRAILWVGLIAVACLTPNDSMPSSSFLSRIPHFDKVVHFMLYSVFTLFLMSGFSRQYRKTVPKAYVYSFLIAFSLGVTIEFIQEYVQRGYDVVDMAANTAGIIVALSLFNTVKWILRNIL
ncbi:MAG: VanZ family protein [Prevotellaceae bacterium]|nr:VanZ family protein [Prevotellaceae bacterium]